VKKFFVLAFELTAYVALGLVIGRYIDATFSLKGWGTALSVFICYFLWLFQIYKALK